MTLVRLTWVFAVLSLLGFGGGNAILPQMHNDAVTHFHWVSSAEFSRLYALGKLAPGPTTLVAALIGRAASGFTGAIVATLAVFIPSSLLVYVAGLLYARLAGNPLRDRFAAAIAPVVLGLVWAGGITLARGAVVSAVTGALAAIAAVIALRSEVNQIYIVLGAGVVGAVLIR